MNPSNSTSPAAVSPLDPSDGERDGVRGPLSTLNSQLSTQVETRGGRPQGPASPSSLAPPAQTRSELLILADGTILAHNLTPALAAVLQVLAPQDETLKLRSTSAPVPERGHFCPQQRPIVSPPPSLHSHSPSAQFDLSTLNSQLSTDYELPN